MLGPPVQEGCGKTGEQPAETTKMVRDLEHSASEGRGLDLGSLVQRRQRGHLPGACDCWKGSDRHESKTPAASGNAVRDGDRRMRLGRSTSISQQ